VPPQCDVLYRGRLCPLVTGRPLLSGWRGQDAHAQRADAAAQPHRTPGHGAYGMISYEFSLAHSRRFFSGCRACVGRRRACQGHNGLLQRASILASTVIGILALIIAAATAHQALGDCAVFAIHSSPAASSLGSHPLLLARRVWIPECWLFTGIIALPAPFVISRRDVARFLYGLMALTAQGLLSAATW